jgi:hypothetical protein
VHILEKIRYPIKSNTMPSRWIIVGIVLFWATALSWLLYREVLPDLISSEPLLYGVEAADEFRGQAGSVPKTIWLVERGGKRCYRLWTKVVYDEEEDLFDIQGDLGLSVQLNQETDSELTLDGKKTRVRHVIMHNHYTVTRHGELVRFDADAKYDLWPSGDKIPVTERPNFFAEFQGKPRDRTFAPIMRTETIEPTASNETELEPVAVSERGCVLNPLHPLHRIRGLRPGQSWSCAVVDPCGLLERPLQVLPVRTEARMAVLKWVPMPKADDPNQQAQVFDIPCRLMTCGDEGSSLWFRTWVHAGDGWVLKQEAHLWGETWTITRWSSLP